MTESHLSRPGMALRKLDLSKRGQAKKPWIPPRPAPTIGERIRALREAKGMSQLDLAQAAGITRPALSSLEKDKHDTRISTLHSVAQGLGLTLSQLLQGVRLARQESDV